MTLSIGTTERGKVFSLPLELVTQSIAILAKKRVGKSYCAAIMAEELMQAGQQVVIIDPTGAHWGLRSSADGKAAGFPIVVIGGDHADLPLEEGSGEVLARAVVERRFSAILDLSLLRKGAATRFLTAFFETLYRLNREPLQLICDEADAYAPQKPFAEEARTLGAMEDLVRRGGIRGIGTTLITQRPAVINKNVLTQCEVLIALRLVHPKDIAAVMEWINVHAEPAQAKLMLESLPSLPIGTAWFWSPGWGDIFERITVRRRKTFDSGATPKPGERVIAPKVLAKIDVLQLGDQIKATVERAKADDPKELRRRIQELERQLATKPVGKPEVKVERIEVPVFNDDACSAMNTATASMMDVMAKLRNAVQSHQAAAGSLVQRQPLAAPKQHQGDRLATPQTRARQTTASRAQADTGLSGPEQRILDAIAWMESIGVQQPEQTAVAFLAGYTIGGGAWNNPRGALRTKGLIEYRGDCLELTEEGLKLANRPETALTADGLQRRVLERLPGPERKILQVLLDIYPKGVSNDDLARSSGYEPGGGAYNNPRGRLRTLGLIEKRGEQLFAREILFP